jgi:hypothetical protein
VSRTSRSLLVLAFAVLLLAPLPAAGIEPYDFTASLLVGLGGPIDDVDPDPGDGNLGFQLGFTAVTETNTHVGVRLGSLDFGSEPLGKLANADLTYINVAGEHRFPTRLYVPGVYLGIGWYRMEGDLEEGGRGTDSSLGFVLGFTGEFAVNRKFAVLVELSAHYTTLDEAQFFGLFQAGVAYHF